MMFFTDGGASKQICQGLFSNLNKYVSLKWLRGPVFCSRHCLCTKCLYFLLYVQQVYPAGVYPACSYPGGVYPTSIYPSIYSAGIYSAGIYIQQVYIQQVYIQQVYIQHVEFSFKYPVLSSLLFALH